MHTHTAWLTRLLALVAVLCLPSAGVAQQPDAAEGTRIADVRVSGVDLDALSPGLQRDLDAIVGTALDWGIVGELADRIELERPRLVTAVRALPDGSGAARVLIVAARRDDDRDDDAPGNVNRRYTIERVVIAGIVESRLSQALRDDLQGLVGTRVSSRYRRLLQRLRTELPGYDVERRLSRGTARGQVVVTFEVSEGEGFRLVHFMPTNGKLLYHGDQKWSTQFDLPMGGRNFRVMPRIAIGNQDDLLEENSGFGLIIEGRNVGSERIGLSFEASRYGASWTDATVNALAAMSLPGNAYDARLTVAPAATFAFTPRLRASAGVSISELEPQGGGAPSSMASAFVGSVGFDQRWLRDHAAQELDVSADIRRAASGLGSDFLYTRLVARAAYRYRWTDISGVYVSAQAGRLTGAAPLFERFSLGNSTTLRGWNKFDFAPAGGDRMAHATVEYRYLGAAFFVDTGAVWDATTERRIRSSAGVGYHRDNFFATLGFPLNDESVRPTFMIGVTF